MFSILNSNETKQDPVEILPPEVVLGIFSYLDFSTLRKICLVSQEWKRLALDETLWKKNDVYDKAISNKKWAQWFGEEVVKDEDPKEEWISLPWNIAEILGSRCPIFPEKKVMDTHMLVRIPKTLNGGLTLKSLGELAKKFFSQSDTGYRYICNNIVDDFGDKSINKSCWVLMTKDLLPGSKKKKRGEQRVLISKLAEKSLISHEVPGTLEFVACVLSQYFDLNIRLFTDHPLIYTRCKEVVRGKRIVVGGFAPSGLVVTPDHYGKEFIGVAAQWKF